MRKLACVICYQFADYHLHGPAEKCAGCKCAADHHEFQPSERRAAEQVWMGMA